MDLDTMHFACYSSENKAKTEYPTDGSGRDYEGVAPKGQNSQAKRPDPDGALESVISPTK